MAVALPMYILGVEMSVRGDAACGPVCQGHDFVHEREKEYMLQEIEPYVFDNQYCSQAPAEDSYVLCYRDNTFLAKRDNDSVFELPAFSKFKEDSAVCESTTYLFSIGDRSFFLLDVATPPEGFSWEPLSATLGARPKHLMFAVLTGYHLFDWYRSRRFCGWCGSRLRKDEHMRALVCPSCRQVEYPRISPAVLVGIMHGNRLLLVKQPSYDRYAIVAGFVEIGETLEEAVAREVMEEVGLKVKSIRYYKSQPWALAGNLMVGFFCEVDGSSEITIDTDELSSAAWFEREDIPLADGLADISLTHEMIALFKNGNIAV